MAEMLKKRSDFRFLSSFSSTFFFFWSTFELASTSRQQNRSAKLKTKLVIKSNDLPDYVIFKE
jgi:hypothetical protein